MAKEQKSLSERIIEAIIGFEPWLEENKRKFIEKHKSNA